MIPQSTQKHLCSVISQRAPSIATRGHFFVENWIKPLARVEGHFRLKHSLTMLVSHMVGKSLTP
jgi:hypothetical protein